MRSFFYDMFKVVPQCASSQVWRLSSQHPIVLISTPLVWVKLRDFMFFSAPGLKVPVGLGFLTHALEGGSSHKISTS
jgi:hypothetical protein